MSALSSVLRVTALAAPAQARSPARTPLVRSRSANVNRSRSVTLRVAAGTEAEPASEAVEAKAKEAPKEAKMPLSEVVVGKTYKGVVRNVQTYGAFVDIGAASDGLVHISQLSTSFVKDPKEVVKSGQEVEVRVLSLDMAAKRVALTMRSEGEERPRRERRKRREGQEGEGQVQGDRPRRERRERREGQEGEGEGRMERRGKVARASKPRAERKAVPFKVGDVVKGQVARILPYGVFVSLVEGVEGLLHQSEVQTQEMEPNLRSMFVEGQEVEVRVLSVEGGKVSVTQKSEEERKPFRGASATVDPSTVKTALEYQMAKAGLKASMFKAPNQADKDAKASTAKAAPAPAAEAKAAPAEAKTAPAPAEAKAAPAPAPAPEAKAAPAPAAEAKAAPAPEAKAAPAPAPAAKAAPAAEAKAAPAAAKAAPAAKAEDEVKAAPKAKATYQDTTVLPTPERPASPVAVEPAVPVVAVVPSPEEARATAAASAQAKAEAKAEAKKEAKTEAKAAPAAPAKTEAKVEAKAAPAKAEAKAAPAAPAKTEAEAAPAAPAKELREATGAGMMDCKKALAECDNDLEKATEYLRKKCLASASKKAGRVAAEGLVQAYIHAGSRLGVLVEVNCETDFVARGEKFQTLANDMAMQVAACPEVEYVSMADVSPEALAKETEIEMGKEDLKSKPENIRANIVKGRVEKLFKQRCLLEQPYIRDQDKTVEEVIKGAIAEIGENIQFRRFERFNLGEGIEKKESNLAADIEEQAAAMKKAAESKAAEAKPEAPVEAKKEPAAEAVQVSAKDVKTLREMTGAGMLDCKKALAAEGGDVEKAAEYLRKKGLASASKKAGRVAAEGVIASYIHAGSRLGVLVEVNCETDFVARGEKFQTLANDMAMQVAACPEVEYVSMADVSPEALAKETEIEMGKEDKSKPENIRANIVKGRVEKLFKQRCLLEQPYIRDQDKTVEEVIKGAIAEIGENIQVRRFKRFNLGEGIEKKVSNLAEEVAAQTGVRA